MERRMSRREQRLAQQGSQPDRDDWDDLLRLVRDGNIIPIVGNSIVYDRLYGPLVQELQKQGILEPESEGCENPLIIPNMENWLASEWSRELKYPLPDCQEMARVAEYAISQHDDNELSAKEDFLIFLKQILIDYAADYGMNERLVQRVEKNMSALTLDQVAQQLSLPLPREDGMQDALEALASLPLSVYVTTSYHTFLERALEAVDKKPRTQICFWRGLSGVINMKEEHETDPDYKPDERNPLVLHLYGLENYPATLVFGEDNYLDFLTRMAQDTNTVKPIIPLYLRDMLDSSSVLLLGYRLQDWDFRVLFRYLNLRPATLRSNSMIIQLSPAAQYRIKEEEKARAALDKYFSKPFKLQWNNTDAFLKKLMDEL